MASNEQERLLKNYRIKANDITNSKVFDRHAYVVKAMVITNTLHSFLRSEWHKGIIQCIIQEKS